MKNSLFICTDNVEWIVGSGPNKDEIVELSGVRKKSGEEYLAFYEYVEGWYHHKFFREIQPPMDIKIEDFIVEKAPA